MAESPFGSPYYQQSITSRATSPASSTNKTTSGVTRKKTRKWVEAKTINYDGSGWGDDDDDEDDDYYDDAPSVPPVASSAYAAPRALPSQQSSSSSSLPSAAFSRSATAPHPSLHLQTESSHSPPPLLPSKTLPLQTLPSQTLPSQTLPSQTLPSQTLPSHTLPSQTLPSQTLPSQTLPSQMPWRQGSPASSTRESSPGIASPRASVLPSRQDGRSDSPLGPRGQSPANSRRGQSPASTATPNGPRAFIRPSDIYKRAIGVDEPSPKKPAELPAAPVAPAPAPPAPAAAAAPAPAPAPAPVELPAEPFVPKHAGLPRTSSRTSSPAPAPTTTTVVETVVTAAPKSADANNTTTTAVDANGERRFSSSPKLPDIARFSMFAPDLLFGGSGFMSTDTPPMPSMPNSQASSTATQSEVTKEATPAAASAAPQSKLASVAEDLDRGSGAASPFSTSSIKSGSASATAAATTAAAAVTTSGKDATPDTSKGTAVGGKSPQPATGPDVSKPLLNEGPGAPAAAANDQIAPLKARRSMQPAASLPLAPVGPRVIERARASSPASASSASSPIKNSDLLREEIIRTLGTVPPASSESEANANSEKSTKATMANDGLSVDSPATAHGGPGAEVTRSLTGDSAYLQNVYDDYWTPDDASGQEAYTPPPVPPLSTGKPTSASTTTMAAPEITASPELAAATPAADLPPQAREAVPPLSSSTSPLPSPAMLSAPSAGPSGLRRQFSWETLQDSDPVPPAVADEKPSAPAAALSSSTSPAPSTAAVAPAPAVQDRSSPVSDHKASASTSSGLSQVAPGSTSASPAPPAEAETAMSGRSRTDSAASPPAAQAPLRSMLDIDEPAAAAAPAAPAASAPAPAEKVEESSTATATASAATAAEDAADVPPLSGSGSTRSAGSVQSWEAAAPADGASAQSPPTDLGGANPAIYGSGNEGTAQFLTLRQCMAFSSHEERMAKLAETRREYAMADSGLSSWLASMTTVPEYTRAAYAPLWDGPTTTTAASNGSRPAATVAAIAHVPHVTISSSQISHKSKEIFGAAGKAGKGLFSLRKKGFHKKSST